MFQKQIDDVPLSLFFLAGLDQRETDSGESSKEKKKDKMTKRMKRKGCWCMFTNINNSIVLSLFL